MPGHTTLILKYAFTFISACSLSASALAASLHGQVRDQNNNPLSQVQVIFDRDETATGASVVTVFTNAQGTFSFPGDYADALAGALPVSARALGYEQVSREIINSASGSAFELTFVMAATSNQVAVAPASAWLGRIEDRQVKSSFILNCVDCHQVPAPEVRAYAGNIANMEAPDSLQARTRDWDALVKYMNYLSGWEFARGSGSDQVVDPNGATEGAYYVGNVPEVVNTLVEHFNDAMDTITGYDWGAPVIANDNTVIWEYEVPHPNAIREALMLGDPAQLWLADVASNNMIVVDVASGEQTLQEVPTNGILMSPHSLHRGADDSLWVTPLFNSIIGHKDMATGEWETWQLKTNDGRSPGIHDLSFGWEHELLSDERGRIWFSDIGNNAVGYFEPNEGNADIWTAPASPGREDFAPAMYGLIMNDAHDEVWYSQLRNGTVGGFDISREEYIGPFQLPDPNAGPRRITITEDDMMYVALYGSGQLLEFDINSRETVGIYDLPDIASAPYAATWDPLRKVVWIPTANGDVIYRFDPATKEYGVLPMPRTQAFMRMLDIDEDTGVLIASYSNIVEIVQGPRMALIIDPGDNVYPEKFTLAKP